jgi:hypothetical protein
VADELLRVLVVVEDKLELEQRGLVDDALSSPGSSAMMSKPFCTMVASAMPLSSTRLWMVLMACSMAAFWMVSA